jgi:hypothetical protein
MQTWRTRIRTYWHAEFFSAIVLVLATVLFAGMAAWELRFSHMVVALVPLGAAWLRSCAR